MTFHPSILAEAATHFQRNQLALLDELRTEQWTVGAMLQRWTLAWLNAVLVAEAAPHQNLVLSNMISVGDPKQTPLVRNLIKLKILEKEENTKEVTYKIHPERLKDGSLFTHYLSCPLIYGTFNEEWSEQLRGKNAPIIKDVYSEISSTKTIILHDLLCGLMPASGEMKEGDQPEQVKNLFREKNPPYEQLKSWANEISPWAIRENWPDIGSKTWKKGKPNLVTRADGAITELLEILRKIPSEIQSRGTPDGIYLTISSVIQMVNVVLTIYPEDAVLDFIPSQTGWQEVKAKATSAILLCQKIQELL